MQYLKKKNRNQRTKKVYNFVNKENDKNLTKDQTPQRYPLSN